MEQYLKTLFSEQLEKLSLKASQTWVTLKQFISELCNELNLPSLKTSQIQEINQFFSDLKKQSIKDFKINEVDLLNHIGDIYDIIIGQNLASLAILLDKKFLKLKSKGNKQINIQQFGKVINLICKTLDKKECSHDTVKLLLKIVDINIDSKCQIDQMIKAIPLLNGVICFRDILTQMEYRNELKGQISKRCLSYSDINRLCQYILPVSSKYFLKTFEIKDQADKDYFILENSTRKSKFKL